MTISVAAIVADVPTLGNTIGAALIGGFGAAILYGFTTILVFLYFSNYPNDWRVQKISVAVLWVLDSFHLALTIALVYHYLVDSFGSELALQSVHWTLPLQIAVNIAIILIVQSLYAVRIWKLGRGHHHRLWAVFVLIFLAGGYAVGIILVRETYLSHTFAEINSISWAIITSFIYATAVDIVLAGAVFYYLMERRSEFTGSNNTIYQIVRMTFISGALTSVCSLTALITYFVLPHTLIFLGIEFLLTKLYINSFLAMLNARRCIREKESTLGSASGNTNRLNIRTTTHSHVHHDGPEHRIGIDEDKNSSIQLTSLGDKTFDLDSTSSWDEFQRTAIVSPDQIAMAVGRDRTSRVTFVQV